jgi:uncharacterized protein YktB (UPF0637 family)
MAITPFVLADFRVFDLPGFAARMERLRAKIRPKLERLGQSLVTPLAEAAGGELFPHVARHARRTVNPPDDTWVAFGPDRRGYKKAAHFKIAVSRHGLRFLFEIGPEHAAKAAFARAWAQEAGRLRRGLIRVPDLAWFRNEHDEDPAAALADLDAAAFARLGEAVMRTRDGQLVLGRRFTETAAARWTPADYERTARETFTALGPCLRLGRGSA